MAARSETGDDISYTFNNIAFTYFSHFFSIFLVVEYCGISSRTVPLMMVSVDTSQASILKTDPSQVMASYTFASLTVPWLAMALSSWR